MKSKRRVPDDIQDDYLQDIRALSQSEVDKVIAVSGAIAKRYDAEACKESQLKMRILFERTAPEMLPFVIYCITFGTVSVISLYRIVDLVDKGGKFFYFALVALIIIMVLPIFILPHIPFMKWFSKKDVTQNDL